MAGCDDLASDGFSRCAWHLNEQQARITDRRAAAKLSAEAQAGAALYATPAWKSARRAYLSSNPVCVDCGELGLVVKAAEVDHITPHRGNRTLFFARSNWQALCKSCHSRKTAREVLPTGGRQKI